MKSIISICCVVGLGIVGLAEGEGDRKPVLSFPFDGSSAKVGNVEELKETAVHGTVKYAEGIKGQALVSGEGIVEYVLPAATVNPNSGSVSLWVKRLNWDKDSYFEFIAFVKRQMIKKVNSKVTVSQIYRPKGHGVVVLRFIGDGNKMIADKESKQWSDNGKWHHLVYTWDGDMGIFFVDGKKVPATPEISVALSKVAIEGERLLFQVGGDSRSYSSEGTKHTKQMSLIDEVKLYKVPLTSAEVTELFNELSNKSSGGK